MSIEKVGQTLENVDFPKFTTSLIDGVFEAVTNNHLAQIKAYSELISMTAKTVKEFSQEAGINEKSEEFREVLRLPLSIKLSGEEYSNNVGDWYGKFTKPSSKDDKTSVANLFELEDIKDVDDIKAQADLKELIILKAAAIRQNILIQMVQMGMMRLVVKKGLIETRLSFRANQSSYSRDIKSEYESERENKYIRGSIGGRIWGVSAGYSKVNTSVKVANNLSVDMSNINIDILGKLRLEIATDYFSLLNNDNE